MKILAIYYSRTGTSTKLVKYIKKTLNCDIEMIEDSVDRSGLLGYLQSGKEASLKRNININPLKSKVENYDAVIVITPIWAFTMSSPIRAFLALYKAKIKRVAFCAVQGGSGADRAFEHMEALVGKKPICTLPLTTKEVMSDLFIEKTNKFIAAL